LDLAKSVRICYNESAEFSKCWVPRAQIFSTSLLGHATFRKARPAAVKLTHARPREALVVESMPTETTRRDRKRRRRSPNHDCETAEGRAGPALGGHITVASTAGLQAESTARDLPPRANGQAAQLIGAGLHSSKASTFVMLGQAALRSAAKFGMNPALSGFVRARACHGRMASIRSPFV